MPSQDDRPFRADHVNLWREELKVRFLFGRFSLFNDMTERTWMRAIERSRYRLTERASLGVIDDHRCPGDGLQRQPLQTNCAAKRKNCGDAADAAKHVRH